MIWSDVLFPIGHGRRGFTPVAFEIVGRKRPSTVQEQGDYARRTRKRRAFCNMFFSVFSMPSVAKNALSRFVIGYDASGIT